MPTRQGEGDLEAGGRGNLVEVDGCAVAVEGLLQMAFTRCWGEEFLRTQKLKVCLSFTIITARAGTDGYSRCIWWDTVLSHLMGKHLRHVWRAETRANGPRRARENVYP